MLLVPKRCNVFDCRINTVDKKTGFFTHNGRHYELVDLPGIYSLSALSQDEEIAREFILEGQADLIINIVMHRILIVISISPAVFLR